MGIICKCSIDDCIEFLVSLLLDALCLFELLCGFIRLCGALLCGFAVLVGTGILCRIILRLRELVSSLLGLTHQIDRAVLDLKIGLSEIQSQNTGAEHLQAAEEYHAAGRCRIAERVAADDQALADREDQQNQTDQTGDKADCSRCSQRRGREADNALERIAEQTPEAPCALACRTLDIFIFQILDAEADPGENALGEAVVFAHGEHRIDHLPRHKAEILCAVHDLGLRNVVHQLVEQSRKPRANLGFALAADSARRGAVIFSARNGGIHFRQEFRRMLQIGVHDHAVIALCIGETRVNARLLAEIARERDVADTLVIFRHNPQGTECAVLGAVVDKQIFKFEFRIVRLHGCRDLGDFLIEHRQDFLLVIARYNDRDELFFFHVDPPVRTARQQPRVRIIIHYILYPIHKKKAREKSKIKCRKNRMDSA